MNVYSKSIYAKITEYQEFLTNAQQSDVNSTKKDVLIEKIQTLFDSINTHDEFVSYLTKAEVNQVLCFLEKIAQVKVLNSATQTKIAAISNMCRIAISKGKDTHPQSAFAIGAIPIDILKIIIEDLSRRDFQSLLQVSKSWNDPKLIAIFLQKFAKHLPYATFIALCCKAGENLEEFILDDKVSYQDLQKVANRCPNLKKLSLNGIDSVGLALFKDHKHVELLHLDNSHIKKEGFNSFSQNKQISSLSLNNSGMDDLSFFEELPNLEHFSLTNIDLFPSVRNLAFLQKLKNLRSLVLHCKLSNECLPSLRVLTNLQKLSLDGSKIENINWNFFKELKLLRHLSLNGSYVNDSDLEKLSVFAPQLVFLSLDECQITHEGLVHLEKFKQLEHISLNRCSKINNQGLASLGKQKGLQHIALEGCEDITKEGLVHIGELENLRYLSLNKCPNILGDDLKLLEKHTNLRYILFGHNINDESLKSLAKHTHLRHIALDECFPVTDEGVIALEPLQHLEHFSLGSANITGVGLASIAKHKKLKSLTLNCCSNILNTDTNVLGELAQLESLKLYAFSNVSDDGLAFLVKLKKLLSLNLDYAPKITDKSLINYVSKIRQIRHLSLQGCQITDQGVASLISLKCLKTLSLNNCIKLTDESLIYLDHLPSLASLTMRECMKITVAGAKNLLKKFSWFS